jgi:hypothetical protein
MNSSLRRGYGLPGNFQNPNFVVQAFAAADLYKIRVIRAIRGGLIRVYSPGTP